ncbi:GNAT family N-acetyltransferase [Bacteroidia bacterium]|nr:GNAT family N-acetyltransferase [Bacteroidia bacterium]
MIHTCEGQSPADVQTLETIIYDTFDDINFDHWNGVIQNHNTYLNLPYLKALETGLPHCGFKYILFYDSLKQPQGVGYCQIIKITAAEIDTEALIQKLGGMLPKSIVNSIDMRILICGNAFASGENGFYFKEKVPISDGLSVLNDAIEEIHAREKKADKKIAITLIKEFWPESFNNIAFLKERGCNEINIDVNMILTLDDSWKTFEDYLGAMNSKFRTKAKQVFKKSSDLTIVDFDVATIVERLNQIDELYNTIVDQASFSFGRLNAQTLLNVKKALGDNFLFKGYYLDDKLIGFSTATAFGDILDGNFIGLDYDYNQQYAVYQRMLYDFAAHAFQIGARQIKIGRTAEEIKSGIGAMPVEMKFYAKHRNKVTNALLRPFISNLKPSEFNLRKPFKANYYNH